MGLFTSWTEKDAEKFHQSELKKAIDRGLKQGMEQGMQQGMEQGMQQGLEQGEARIIRAMRSNGASVEEIVRLTGIKNETVEKILENEMVPAADGKAVSLW